MIERFKNEMNLRFSNKTIRLNFRISKNISKNYAMNKNFVKSNSNSKSFQLIENQYNDDVVSNSMIDENDDFISNFVNHESTIKNREKSTINNSMKNINIIFVNVDIFSSHEMSLFSIDFF